MLHLVFYFIFLVTITTASSHQMRIPNFAQLVVRMTYFHSLAYSFAVFRKCRFLLLRAREASSAKPRQSQSLERAPERNKAALIWPRPALITFASFWLPPQST
jgi:hypothetical protein